MSAAERRKRQFEQREQLLLEAAERVLEQEGAAGLSMDKLGAMIDYSRATVYLHFANKADVLTALAAKGMTELQSACERIALEHMSSRRRLLSIMVAYQWTAMRHPHLARLTTTIYDRRLIEQAADARRRELDRARHKAASLAAGVVREAIAAGDLDLGPNPNPFSVMLPIWTLMMGGGVILSDTESVWHAELDTPQVAMYHGLAAYLDGLGWHPVGEIEPHDAVLARVDELLFTGSVSNT